jgi:hypothetical protein
LLWAKVAQDPFDAAAGKDRCFDGHFTGRTFMNAVACAAILALGVLSNAENVEFFGSQQTGRAFQQFVRSCVYVEIKGLSYGQQQAMQGYRIWDFRRPADRAKQNGVKRPKR